MMTKESKIFVAGHRGMVGSAIVRRLESQGFHNILTAGRDELDLRNQASVDTWFANAKPEFVFLVAGTVGGILANSTRPAEFIYDNILIHSTVIHAAYQNRVTKLLYLGSACIYPRECAQPIREDALLTGTLEPTNEAYAIAKISGIKMCQAYRRQYGCNFIAGMPTNLYGPGDNFNLSSSHVLPALLRKCVEAQEVGRSVLPVWGSGSAKREFLHVDDLADACFFLMQHYEHEQHVNIGTGLDVSIRDLALMIRDVAAPGLTLEFDASKPDGMPRRVLDVSRLHDLGWRHRIELADGIRSTYEWYMKQAAAGGVRA